MLILSEMLIYKVKKKHLRVILEAHCPGSLSVVHFLPHYYAQYGNKNTN